MSHQNRPDPSTTTDTKGPDLPADDAAAKDDSEERGRVLLREHYADLLGMLSLAEELTAQVASLRATWNTLHQEKLPHLEQLTSIDNVETTLLRPHRERLTRLRVRQKEEQARQQRLLVERTLNLLRSDVSLSVCLRLVGTLRQQPDVSPEQLPGLFLGARTAFITGVIEKSIISGDDSLSVQLGGSTGPRAAASVSSVPRTDQLEAIVKVMKGPVLDVVAQYGALFDGEPLPLAAFLSEQIAWCIASVTTFVRAARNTALLAAYWNQLVILNVTLAGVRAAFLPLIKGIFEEQARVLLTQALASAASLVRSRWNEISNQEKDMTDGKKLDNRSGPTVGIVPNSKEMRAPPEVLLHPSLILINNALVDVFDQIRAFALPSLYPMIRELLQAHLQTLETSLLSEPPGPSNEVSRSKMSPTDPSSSSISSTSLESPACPSHPSSVFRKRLVCFQEHLKPFLLETTLETLFPNAVDCGANYLS